MNHEFSAKRQASIISGRPCSCAISLTALIFAMLTGWPPPELLVTVSITNGMFATPTVLIVSRSASKSMLPLKLWDRLRLAAFGDDQIAGVAFEIFDVGACRVEMRVVGDDLAAFDGVGKEDVFGGASLMCGDDVFEAGDVLDSRFEPIERLRSGIRLVADDHARHCCADIAPVPLSVSRSINT